MAKAPTLREALEHAHKVFLDKIDHGFAMPGLGMIEDALAARRGASRLQKLVLMAQLDAAVAKPQSVREKLYRDALIEIGKEYNLND